MEERNYLKMAALLIGIGASAIVLNLLFTAMVSEWKKPSENSGDNT